MTGEQGEMRAVRVNGIFIGKAKQIGLGLTSALDKQPVRHRLWLWPQGLGGDQAGDARYHGGLERALLHYPAEHYAFWRREFPHIDWQPGAFGENLSSSGLSEARVCIGDLFRWGDALLQVSQPHSPSYAIAHRWELPGLPQWLQDTGRCGWYYRVVKPGFVSSENRLQLLRRSYPGLSVAQALRSFYHAPLERAGLQQLVACQALSARWRELAAQRLASGRLEDWSARLLGEAPEGLRA